MTSALLGIDVGFSAKIKTTGLAWRVRDQVEVGVAGSSWESRHGALPEGVRFSLAAFDAPVLRHDIEILPRACEAVFYRRPFWNRCRPGLTHHGRGAALRDAGREAVSQFARVLASGPLAWGPSAIANAPIIEAFPNAFLGVLVSEEFYSINDSARHRSKSDWLYEGAVESGALARVLRHLGWTDRETITLLQSEIHHDKRAALVCLLTAGLANMGAATIVGDSAGGWFWLPPKSLWALWAIRGLDEALARSRQRGFDKACIWQDSTNATMTIYEHREAEQIHRS